MQDSVAYESYPSHPLGARDSWPATGPVYGLPDVHEKAEAAKTIWQRLVSPAPITPEIMEAQPASSPIFY